VTDWRLLQKNSYCFLVLLKDAMIIKIDLRFLKHIADSIGGGPNAPTRTSPSLERCRKFTFHYSFLKAIFSQ
jgi:hypothetical protein